MPMVLCPSCGCQSWRNLASDPCNFCSQAPTPSLQEGSERFRAAAALLREEAQDLEASDKEGAATLRREALHLEHAAAESRWATRFVAGLVQSCGVEAALLRHQLALPPLPPEEG